jgi:hypothetical protein
MAAMDLCNETIKYCDNTENSSPGMVISIVSWSSIYKSYCAQWKSLVVRNGTLHGPWELADGRTKTAQSVIPRSKKKCWQRCMKDLQEYTLESIRHLIRSHGDTIGCIREVTLGDGFNSVTSAQQAEALKPEDVASRNSTM